MNKYPINVYNFDGPIDYDFNNPSTIKIPESGVERDDVLVALTIKTMDNDYGTGDTRKNNLGDNYEIVQDIVDNVSKKHQEKGLDIDKITSADIINYYYEIYGSK